MVEVVHRYMAGHCRNSVVLWLLCLASQSIRLSSSPLPASLPFYLELEAVVVSVVFVRSVCTIVTDLCAGCALCQSFNRVRPVYQSSVIVILIPQAPPPSLLAEFSLVLTLQALVWVALKIVAALSRGMLAIGRARPRV